MQIYLSPHPTAAVEIATGLTALAMTVVVGGWSIGFGGAVIVPGRRGHDPALQRTQKSREELLPPGWGYGSRDLVGAIHESPAGHS